MKNWLFSAHLIFSIGGGTAGALDAIASLLVNSEVTLLSALIEMAYFSMYVIGVIAGLSFAKNRESAKLLEAYYTVQVPYLVSPIISYQFVGGAHVTGTAHWPGLGIEAYLGSDYYFALTGAQNTTIGINFIATLLLYDLVEGLSNKSVDSMGTKAPNESP